MTQPAVPDLAFPVRDSHDIVDAAVAKHWTRRDLLWFHFRRHELLQEQGGHPQGIQPQPGQDQ